jgi:hypothetical protein
MTEGVTHVQERNEQLTANDLAAAWKENRILEKYYAPVLDTPSYVSRTGHRWSPEQRAGVPSRVSGTDAGYVSAANPYPIYAWSRAWFWVMSIGLAVAFWFVCVRLDRGAGGSRKPKQN